MSSSFNYARQARDLHGGDRHPFFSWFQVVWHLASGQEEVELDFIAARWMANALASERDIERHIPRTA
jgi:hypothetical protein